MPQGMQVFDAAGNLIVDITDRLTRVLGTIQVDGNDGSLSHPVLAEGGIPWATVSDYTVNIIQQSQPPIVTFSGSTMTWKYVGPSSIRKVPAAITYGVY